MARIPKGRSVEGPYQPICRDCAMYFSITVFLDSLERKKSRSIQEFEHPDLFWSLSSCMKPLMSIAQTEKTMASWRRTSGIEREGKSWDGIILN